MPGQRLAATNYALWLLLRTHGVPGSRPSTNCSSELFEVGTVAACLHFIATVTIVLKREGKVPLISLLLVFPGHSLFTVVSGDISRTQLLQAVRRDVNAARPCIYHVVAGNQTHYLITSVISAIYDSFQAQNPPFQLKSNSLATKKIYHFQSACPTPIPPSARPVLCTTPNS